MDDLSGTSYPLIIDERIPPPTLADLAAFALECGVEPNGGAREYDRWFIVAVHFAKEFRSLSERVAYQQKAE